MNNPILWRIEDELSETGIDRSSGEGLSLLILAWAKLTSGEKVPSHLRLTSELLEDPKRIETSVAELSQVQNDKLAVFSDALSHFPGKASALLPALKRAVQLIDAGLVGSVEGWFAADFSGARQDSHDRLNPLVAQLLVEVASIASADSVYVPWDARGQLAARASAVGRSVYLETPAHSLIPGSVALLCDKPFEVHFSDPIRLPSAIDKGKPVKFDRAICFPPINVRHEMAVAQKDWFGRFPESTGLGSVLAIRHLLWQTTKRAVVAVPNNVLFSTGAEQQLREDLLGRGIVEAVIAMHSGLLTKTNISFSILVLDPRGGHKQVRFVRGDADRFVEAESKARFRLSNFLELAQVINVDEDTEVARNIPVEKIGSDAQLQPSRYLLTESTKRLFDVISSARTATLGELVRTIRPMNTKADKGNTIEVHEIGAGDLPTYGFIDQPGRTVKMDGLTSAMNEDQFLRADDIVLIVKGSVGKVGIIFADAPGPGPGGWIAGQSAIVLRLKETSRMNAKALALQLRSEIGQNLLKNIVSGATIPLIQLRELMAMPIVLPSIEEQHRAAQVLEEEARLQMKIDELRERQSKIAAGLWALDDTQQEGRAASSARKPRSPAMIVEKPGRRFRD